MSDVTNPFLLSLFPSQEKIIPNHTTTPDGWVLGNATTGNNTFFSTQWVQCSYQISGGYGPTSRYVFYLLMVLSVLARRVTWVSTAALASVMTYSSAAAIHALVIVIIRQRLAPSILFENGGNWEVVLAEGPTSGFGDYEPLDPKAVWLPLLPMVWDDDIDPVLAIIGSAFLVVIVMQNWSSTLRKASFEVKIIIAFWTILLLIGTISALVAEQYFDFWSFPQLRFCPPGRHDTLPFMNNGPSPYVESWIPGDWYRWNRTLREHFIFQNTTRRYPSSCLYPCFDFTWQLRDPSDIYVVANEYGSEFNDTNASWALLVAAYVIIVSAGLSSLTLLVVARFSRWEEFRDVRFSALYKKTTQTWNSTDRSKIRKFWRLTAITWVFLVSFYGFVLSIPAWLLFVGYLEWEIWSADPGGESFRHVGQWGALVAIVIVLAAAVLQHFLSIHVKKQNNFPNIPRHTI